MEPSLRGLTSNRPLLNVALHVLLQLRRKLGFRLTLGLEAGPQLFYAIFKLGQVVFHVASSTKRTKEQKSRTTEFKLCRKEKQCEMILEKKCSVGSPWSGYQVLLLPLTRGHRRWRVSVTFSILLKK
jgi:hypothetical protein